MKTFNGKLAVLTGGSSGIGRQLAIQLAAQGCNLALCATSSEKLDETKDLCEAAALAQGVRITTHVTDVSDEAQVLRFRDAVLDQHSVDCIDLLINNAGIAGSGSFVNDSREQWERVFNINWYGVYYNTRAFLPLLMAAQESHIVNVSSIAGFWATGGAYSTSKFVVKGFTEALVADLRRNAPHVKASVVMPGKVSTDLIARSQKHLGRERSPEVEQSSKQFADSAPTSDSQAANIILDGIRAERWRILVGVDAEQLDQLVRETPDEIYDEDFVTRIDSWN